MGFRFRRRKNGNGAERGVLGGDANAARTLLQEVAAGNEDSRFELREYVQRLFDDAPTRDITALKDGTDAASFYENEVSPNWDGLSSGQRASKIAAFTRLANALGSAESDPAGMGPVVRTKLLVLAWAHDEVYGDEQFLRQLESAPERFGAFEFTR